MVKASASPTAAQGFDLRLTGGNFSGWRHASDLKSDAPEATLLCVWRYRVSAGIGWAGDSVMWQGEEENLISNFCLSVAARTIV